MTLASSVVACDPPMSPRLIRSRRHKPETSSTHAAKSSPRAPLLSHAFPLRAVSAASAEGSPSWSTSWFPCMQDSSQNDIIPTRDLQRAWSLGLGPASHYHPAGVGPPPLRCHCRDLEGGLKTLRRHHRPSCLGSTVVMRSGFPGQFERIKMGKYLFSLFSIQHQHSVTTTATSSLFPFSYSRFFPISFPCHIR